jgi:radical SAM superfamily enzyme YgiQ (UPF0313 family)
MDIILFTCVSGIFFQRSIGAYQIAHFLRKYGYSVQVIDFTDYFTSEELINVVSKFVGPSTLAVGVSTTFYTVDNKSKFIHNDEQKFELAELPENILTIIEHIKTQNQNVKVILGGAKSESGKNIPNVDVVIHGYAEDKILDYLNSLPNNIKKKKQHKFLLEEQTTVRPKIISNDPLDKSFSIEELDHRFTHNDVILPNEVLPLEVSRGCIFKCSFCAFPLNGKSKLDYLRDPTLIKEELIYNYETFGTTNYFLSDDTFNDSTAKIEKIHRVITDLPFKINFTTYLRLDLLNAHKEQISMLAEMGLASPFFGVESLNQRSATSIGKGMNVDRAKEFLLELHYDYWKEKLPITCSFIIGLPYETVESIHSTYEWAKNNPINSVFFPLNLTSKTYYKSEFNTNYKDYGYQLDTTTDFWSNDHFNYSTATSLAEQYNQELMRSEDYPSSWFLMILLNHGYSIEEASKIKMKDLNYSKILRHRQQSIKSYKQKILSINT